jgi:hypothetical protein
MFEFDLPYILAAVVGVPLMFVVLGLTYICGKLGAKGRTQFICSLVIGLVLGFLYMLSVTRPPSGDWWVKYVYWFGNAFYALGLGVLASLFYDTAKEILLRWAEKFLPTAQ